MGWPQFKNYNCYLIQVIQRKPSGDVCWHPPKRASREDIRLIGAQEVYADATGNPGAFAQVFQAINQVLAKRHGFESSPSRQGHISGLYDRAFDN
ncbi:MAG: Eco47II family restriction endonuclease [Propionibacteriaceae bacterium]|nr:Eco47II family restriction endonuclease [Propionibacteriaceae bacterium]